MSWWLNYYGNVTRYTHNYHYTGLRLGMTYLKKPLTVEKIKDIFLQEVNKKESKGGRKALYGLILACCLSIMLWVFLIRIWR